MEVLLFKAGFDDFKVLDQIVADARASGAFCRSHEGSVELECEVQPVVEDFNEFYSIEAKNVEVQTDLPSTNDGSDVFSGGSGCGRLGIDKDGEESTSGRSSTPTVAVRGERLPKQFEEQMDQLSTNTDQQNTETELQCTEKDQQSTEKDQPSIMVDQQNTETELQRTEKKAEAPE